MRQDRGSQPQYTWHLEVKTDLNSAVCRQPKKPQRANTQPICIENGEQSFQHLCLLDYILPYFIRVNSITDGKGPALIITGPSSLHGITWWFNLIFRYILSVWLLAHVNFAALHSAHTVQYVRINFTSVIRYEKVSWPARLIKMRWFTNLLSLTLIWVWGEVWAARRCLCDSQ